MAKFQAEMFEQLSFYHNQSADSKLETMQKDLLFDGLQLHMQFDVIYYGIITQQSFPPEKAQRILTEVKEMVRNLYKGNVEWMFKQSNVERNFLSKFMTPKVNKILENYNTSISNKNLNAAFQKVDEIKSIAGRSIEKMQKNMEQTEDLLKAS